MFTSARNMHVYRILTQWYLLAHMGSQPMHVHTQHRSNITHARIFPVCSCFMRTNILCTIYLSSMVHKTDGASGPTTYILFMQHDLGQHTQHTHTHRQYISISVIDGRVERPRALFRYCIMRGFCLPHLSIRTPLYVKHSIDL